ncbi:hypothetical protein [Burkholderia lata]|uniref:hypothetical protein n=1 Tax=Burkholderia lata (strain ATCC 17760 / DSM 23089 / LMG 22485 / NCIMB 9086 / R18194 / 383) TaxID=482957 RepID=UPI001588DE35|nr:hypothetical protein [Burkholderia lata]
MLSRTDVLQEPPSPIRQRQAVGNRYILARAAAQSEQVATVNSQDAMNIEHGIDNACFGNRPDCRRKSLDPPHVPMQEWPPV